MALAAGSLASCPAPSSAPETSSDAGRDLGPSHEAALPAADWVIRLDRSSSAGRLSPALLGHYDLSGALLGYDRVAGLVSAMKQVGFSEWRVGLGRWEIATQLLRNLTDGTSCAADLSGFPPQAFAPLGSTDFELMNARDWFTYTDGTPVTKQMTADDHRYALAYVRRVIDVAGQFGAAPYVSIDLMPRALSAGKTPTRTSNGPVPQPCTASFSNGVSNAAPADPAVFAAAVVGMVKRVVEGSGAETGRPVVRWELWNEPEFPQFWDKRYEPKGNLDEFFKMAILALVELDAYRRTSTQPAVTQLRFGLGSFGRADSAAAVLQTFDTSPLTGGAHVPVDFISFHAYGNDPLPIAAQIDQVVAARRQSKHYQDAELVLAEWGPSLDGVGWDDQGMDLPLLISTVVALGATAGLDRAHHAIFWDFYAPIRFGLLDHAVEPKPLLRVYSLLAALVGGGNVRLKAKDQEDGRLEDGQGALLAAIDASGLVRLLLINRGSVARASRVELDGKPATPSRVLLFDDPKAPARVLSPSGLITLPPRSVALLELS